VRKKISFNKLLLGIWVIFVLIPPLFVFYWMFSSSFKTQTQNLAIPPVLFFKPYFGNYVRLFQETPILQYFTTSMVVGTVSTLLALLLGLPAAYSLSRWKNNFIVLSILTARMMPGISYLVPWFIFFTRFRLVGSHTALILSHLTITLPLVVWIMIGFFEELPVEVLDSARIDGCSEAGVLLRVALPMSKPGITASAILAFMFSWNNFLYSLVLGGAEALTLPVAAYKYLSYAYIDWGGLNAVASTVVLPVIIMTLLVQKHIAKGLTLGAVKG